MLDQTAKAEIVAKYGTNAEDTGSTSVQVALLTARIQYLTEHFKTHKHDHHLPVHTPLCHRRRTH